VKRPAVRAAVVLTWTLIIASILLRIWLTGWTAFFIAVAVILVCGVYARVWTVRSRPVGTSWWAPTSFQRRLLDDPARFPGVKLSAKWRAALVSGTVAGRLIVSADGIRWLGSRWLLGGLSTASGRVELPWPLISQVTVEGAPGKLPWIGGLVVITLTDGFVLEGEFLCSPSALRAVLPACGSLPEAL
jgi:hypothetical protein